MEIWSPERKQTYMKYIENDMVQLKKWEQKIVNAKQFIEDAEFTVENYKKSIKKMEKELSDQEKINNPRNTYANINWEEF